MMTREWYMHPNGQLPSYEWDLGDVQPAGASAWAAFGGSSRSTEP